MDFVRTYFNTKIGALEVGIGLVKDAWKQRIWLAVALMILYVLFVNIVGALFMPIDFVFGAVKWHTDAAFRRRVKETEEEITHYA